MKHSFLYQWLVALLGAGYFVCTGLFLSLLALLLRPLLNKVRAARVARLSMHYVTRLFFSGLEFSGLVRTDFKVLDRFYQQKSLIITPNHPCLMDALFITSRLPNVVCVMKASIIRNPIFFGVAKLGGFIRSDAPARFVKECQQVLNDGGQLLLFPEGTRTIKEPINPFKGGFALIAEKSGAPIQTVFIQANTEFLGKHWSLWKKPPFPLVYRIQVGDRFNVEKSEDHKAFCLKLEKYFHLQLSK